MRQNGCHDGSCVLVWCVMCLSSSRFRLLPLPNSNVKGNVECASLSLPVYILSIKRLRLYADMVTLDTLLHRLNLPGTRRWSAHHRCGT